MIDKDKQKSLAIDCFNKAWDFLDKDVLLEDEKVELLHLVHTSRYHWGQVGELVHRARGEWQISRAYAKLKLFQASLLHANMCLKLSLEGELTGFDLAFSYEAIARAKAGLKLDFKEELYKGIEYANLIEENEDREYTLHELMNIK